MKTLIATTTLCLAFVSAPISWAQFVPGPNPIDGTVTAAQTISTGTGTVASTGDLEISGSTVAITVTGSCTIENNGIINQTGTGRAIRDNTGGLTLTIQNNAGALLQAADADPIQMNKSSSSISFDNQGSIISLNASAGGSQAIDWTAITTGSNTLHNFATGFIEAFEADAVRPGANGVVLNEGVIKSVTTMGNSSDGIDAQTNSGIDITNTSDGLVEGGRHGITGGPSDDTVNFVMNVTNELNSTIQGDDGSGMNIDGFNANEVVTIQNDGTITGNGATGDGDGVDVDGLVDLTNTGVIISRNAFSDVPGGASEGVTTGGGSIVNSGTIEGDVVAGNVNAVGRGITLAGVDTTGSPEAIYADSTISNTGLIKGQTDSGIVVLGPASGFTVTIDNNAGGKIEGAGNTAAAVQTGADNDTLNNAGEIVADSSGKAIDLGDGDDRLNVTGGSASITGDISGGAGTNTLTIDLGPGNFFSYPGAISDFSSVEIESGIVTLSGASSYTGTTTINGGELVVANTTGSATGFGPVEVNAGAVGGNGIIGGAVTVGGNNGRAMLSPGLTPRELATLTIQDTLTFETGGGYAYNFKANATQTQSDEVIANGVTISGGVFRASGLTRGHLGGQTVLTVISNTSATPIAGAFANLPDGAIITIDGTNFQTNYEGGDGNDLTLTVVP
ncbi:MAG TPA: autotransporter-associated beta strand repeat-containing protein [Chthoniobacterales bacterium]|jgi:autotransporter-associated beta strand protein